MASIGDPAGLGADQLRIVDQARQRLDQLTKSIEAARHAVVMGRPMPDLKALQSHSNILTQVTSSITNHIATNADLLSTLVAYPSTNFPGRTQEPLAGHLLRKKLEPKVEAWVDEGRAVGKEANDNGEGKDSEGKDTMEADWYQAAGWTAGKAQKFMDESEGRKEEMKEEEEEEEREDGDVEMDGSMVAVAEDAGGKADGGRPEMTVAQMARYMNTGIMP